MFSDVSQADALTVSGGQLSFGASTLATNGSTANLINNGGLLIFSNGLTVATSTGSITYASITNNSGTLRVDGSLNMANPGGVAGGGRLCYACTALRTGAGPRL